ncbi:MAG: hypothetical protein LBD58_04360 [Treponema sp.]|jgi:hypothetical protein|nr:hypothetical protein [Treponema sp.]
MPVFLNKDIADALCTVITLGYAYQRHANGRPLTFEYTAATPAEINEHRLLQDFLGRHGVNINVGPAASQDYMPYILGSDLPQNSLNTFINGLTQWSVQINNMFLAANAQNPPPRGAYIGVQFFADANGNMLRGNIANGQGGNFNADPLVYGPSALSLHKPIYRMITLLEEQGIGIAYYNARMSTNNAARAIANGLQVQPSTNFDTNYQEDHIFGSSHGMIRAMVNNVTPPPGIHSVFAEIALGGNTQKVSSCVPCAIFMESFGKPASSIHLGRGDNWRIPDNPTNGMLTNWQNVIVGCYVSGLAICNPAIAAYHATLDNIAAMIIAQHHAVGDILPEIPYLFLEALTFEDSFINRILRTLRP